MQADFPRLFEIYFSYGIIVLIEMSMMRCNLCRHEKELAKAHILPRWAFMYLYPKDEIKRQPLMVVKSKQDEISHTGIYDSGILCGECDSFIGQFDDYGKKVILESPIEDHEDRYIIRNVDIVKLHIFFLSTLWRCSISNRKEFHYIKLGPYEQRVCDLLKKLKTNQAIEHSLDDFPIVVTRFGYGNYPDLVDKNMQIPLSTRIKDTGINCNLLYFPRGFKVCIKTDKRNFPQIMDVFKLKDSNLIIPKLVDFQNSVEFKFMVKAVTKTS